MNEPSRRWFLTGGLFDREEAPEPAPEVRGPVAWQDTGRVIPQAAGGNLVARVMPFSCLNQLGGACVTCAERCPVPDAVCFTGRTPTVVPELCTGCGDCARLCPAPGNAILMVPRAV